MTSSSSLPPGPYAPLAAVIETDLEHELILLDPATQEMFSLNETGRAIWRALSGRTVREAAEELSRQFDVEPGAAEVDVRALVAQLLDAKLITVTSDAGE